jgi:hypothetical protein
VRICFAIINTPYTNNDIQIFFYHSHYTTRHYTHQTLQTTKNYTVRLCDIIHGMDWLVDLCIACRGGYENLRTKIGLGESVRKQCKRWPEGDGSLIGIKFCKKRLWVAVLKIRTKSSLTTYIDTQNNQPTSFLSPFSFALSSAAVTAETLRAPATYFVSH